MIINDMPLRNLKDILANDTPLTIKTTEALINRLEQAEQAVSLVRAMAQDWDANGNACALGDPAASVWHGTAHAIRFTLDRALDGDTRGQS